MENKANRIAHANSNKTAGILPFFRSGHVLVALAALAWSWKSILVKIVFEYGVDATTLILMRTVPIVPAAFLALYILEGPQGLRLTWKEFRGFAVIGIGGMLGSMYFSFRSIELLEASIATLIAFVYPAVTIVLQAILERRLRPVRLLAAAITFAGLALVLGGDSTGKTFSLLGIVFGLCCALAFSLNNILSEKILKGVSPLKLTAWSMLIFASCLATAAGPRPYPREAMPWVIGLTLGFAVGLLPFLMFLHGMRKIGAGLTGLINTLGPVLTVIWAMLFLGETRQPAQLLGIAVVLGGILLLRLETPRARNSAGTYSFRMADKKILALLYVPFIKKRD